ncbi:MAG: galactokinase, partial [Ignavibacteriae bacterium HGW-Ignavibacteriae-2]
MSNNLYEKIANLYGNDENECKYQRDRFNRIINLYSKYFNEQDKISILSTPGRTELSGNHTDHN